jgi:DNA-binding transcriptional ArsR family regulator
MFVDQLVVAIGDARSDARLVELNHAVLKGHYAGALNDDDAQRLAELIHARRMAARTTEKPARRYVGSRPRSSASMERRRSWAAAGRLPPALAARFTLAEQAVLAVVAVEVSKRGSCNLTVAHLAALAGVSESTARNALRESEALGLVSINRRRRTAWMNYPNSTQILSKEWLSWLRLRTGAKSYSPRPEFKKRREKSGIPPAAFEPKTTSRSTLETQRGFSAGPRRLRVEQS